MTDPFKPAALPGDRARHAYHWPYRGACDGAAWESSADGRYRSRALPETAAELSADSRWPAFFPSPLCIVTTINDGVRAVEKVVGASIVNRFPYILALSFCREPLSARHYVRRSFLDLAQSSGRVAVQFFMPGPALAGLMKAIAEVPDDRPEDRFSAAGLPTRSGTRSGAPVFEDACLVYEGRFVAPGTDFDGVAVNGAPWFDAGSHRVLLFEIESIMLRKEIACGAKPVQWRSLPTWSDPQRLLATHDASAEARRRAVLSRVGYVKAYRPDYVFPDKSTIAFEADGEDGDFAVKHLAPLPADQVEVDNDRARWPCFFPSSLGVITVDAGPGRRSAFACGSTTVISRQPLTVAVCVSYARINARYAPRASLELLRAAGRFGCGVPVYNPEILEAIAYLGNVSWRDDPKKMENCGLTPVSLGGSVGFSELPVHLDCRIVDEVRLGTHSMFLGRVDRVFVRSDLTFDNPLEWCPWAGGEPVHDC